MTPPHLDRHVAALAARQRGAITRAQLIEIGLTASAIHHRVANGRLHRLHRGVYAVGHPAPATRFAREHAALLAHGPLAVLSHGSAAAVWRMVAAPAERVDVTVAGSHHRSTAAIRVHETRALDVDEVCVRDGLRLTNPSRTLRDLAVAMTPAALERAVDAGRAQRLVSVEALEAEITSRRAGAGRLRAVTTTARDGFSRSEGERRTLALIRSARLPAPKVNARVAGLEVDVLWPEHRVALEVDGHAFHATPAAFARDRRRDATLRAHGFVVLRTTWEEIVRRPYELVAQLAVVLEHRPTEGTAARARETG